jgi:gamma-glutamylcyclotransferase (GGCT)/AIG2-like uncharacterized protein YtfP
MTRVFVYGTLMSGGRLNTYGMEGATFVRPATMRGTLWSVGQGFPAFTDNDPFDGVVHGELWDVDFDTLQRLDGIEGFRRHQPEHSMYLRVIRRTLFGEPVWVYLWNGDTDRLQLIESGCWRTHEEERAA